MTNPKPFSNCKFCNVYFFKMAIRQNVCSITCAFLSRVHKKSENECWPWLGGTHSLGYGEFGFLNEIYRAHRFSLEYYNNIKLKSDEHVLHSCDNPNCCNPSHLRKGTTWDNMDDKARRAKQGNRLTREQVIQIKELLKQNEPKASIAKKFNVSQTNIYYIATGKHWRHV